MKETLVVIPYWAQGAQGHELELAVAGWKKHFKEPHRIVVVGDQDDNLNRAVWHHDAGYVKFLQCPQVAPIPGQYLPHLDHVHKFREVRQSFPDTEGFIYTCDDIYPTADSTLEDVKRPKEPVRGFGFMVTKPNGRPDWYSDKLKTGALCMAEGLPVRNWVCHLPVYYDWERLLSIYDRYDCDHRSYIVENIYFNELYPHDPHASPEREYHDEVTGSFPDIRPLGTVRWVSNANSGWSPRLEEMLRRHYGMAER